MAYFADSTKGVCFDEQCSKCKYGLAACPIFQVQYLYNYDACNNEIARKILDHLVSDDGTCAMFERFKEDFEIDKSQLKLFDD